MDGYIELRDKVLQLSVDERSDLVSTIIASITLEQLSPNQQERLEQLLLAGLHSGPPIRHTPESLHAMCNEWIGQSRTTVP